MANENKDVKRVEATAANIPTTLINLQLGFDTTNERLAFKDSSGNMHYFEKSANINPTDITLTDNAADAFKVREASNNYIHIATTDSSEAMTFGNASTNPSYTFLGSGETVFNGYVGVGVSTPSYPLHVERVPNGPGDIAYFTDNSYGALKISTDTNFSVLLDTASSSGQFVFTRGGATVTLMTLDKDGNVTYPDGATIGPVSDVDAITLEADGDVLFSQKVGIGGTPSEILHVFGDSDIDNVKITIHNTKQENIDSGRETNISFSGEKLDGTSVTMATITSAHDGAGDDAKGKLILGANDDDVSAYETLILDSDQLATFAGNIVVPGDAYIGVVGDTQLIKLSTNLVTLSDGLTIGADFTMADDTSINWGATTIAQSDTLGEESLLVSLNACGSEFEIEHYNNRTAFKTGAITTQISNSTDNYGLIVYGDAIIYDLNGDPVFNALDDSEIDISNATSDYPVNILGTGGLNVTGRVKEAGTFAEIHVHGASTAQSIPTGATYTKLTAFTDNGASSNCTADATNDKITLTKTGYYKVSASMSASSGTANVVFKCSPFLGGVEQNNSEWERKFATGGDVGSMSITGIIDNTSINTDLDLRVIHDNVGSVNLTVTYANLNVTYLGET